MDPATSTDRDRREQALLALMKKGDNAFNARDIDAMEAVHHPEVYVQAPGGEPTTTMPPHRRSIEGMIEAFPDLRVHNDPYPVQFATGAWSTVISRVTGTFTGRMQAPDGTVIPPTGRSFDVAFATTARWSDDDRVVEEYIFWDTAMLAEQIGLAGQDPAR